tara:strand:+ start:13022 stop:13486 length:465 start_codon:yes stop_codon:yes gene_type:complete
MKKESNILVNKDEIFLLDEKLITKLKNLASKHPLKRSRICLHQNEEELVHEMIIVAKKDGIMEPHKHPFLKPESYHVIEGKLKVVIYNDDSTIKEEFHLDDQSHPRMYRIKGNVWHQPIPLTEWVVYHEVATGPFNKNNDVIYLEEFINEGSKQ